MSIEAWIALYCINSLWWKWILSWGGASFIEGFKSIFLIDWFALDWSAEQIRFYALCIWVFTSLWFAAGLFVPELRGTTFLL